MNEKQIEALLTCLASTIQALGFVCDRLEEVAPIPDDGLRVAKEHLEVADREFGKLIEE
jgi:hypothetical protein